MTKRVFTILLVGLSLYILSSVLTFSWTAHIPDADVDAPHISALCSHPFGVPLQFTSWELRCTSDTYILLAQGFNLVFWLLLTLIGHTFTARSKNIKNKFTRYPRLAWPTIITGILICAAVLCIVEYAGFFFTLAGISTYEQIKADTAVRTNFEKELVDNYVEYKNDTLGFSIYIPKEASAKEAGTVQDRNGRGKNIDGSINFYKNNELYFTVEAVKKDAPTDNDFTAYDDLAHVFGGRSPRTSLDTYMHLSSSKPNCVRGETVRTSCKDYFTSQISGFKYNYILSGFAEELPSLGPNIKPTIYISDHSYDKLLFSFKPLN